MSAARLVRAATIAPSRGIAQELVWFRRIPVIRRLNVAMLMMVVVCMGAADALVAQSAPAAKRPQTAPPGGQAAAKAAGPRTTAKAAADAAPVIVVETDKGTFEFTTFPKEAPKSVEHIVTLVKRNFYNGQHFHRVEPNFVV